MAFEHIGLLALTLPLAILAWALLKQRTDIGHSSFSLFEGMMAINFNLIQRVFVCLAIILAVIALAKPYHEEIKKITTVQEGRELVVLIDTSSSMDETTTEGGKKIDLAKTATANLVKNLPENRFALFSFADRSQLEWPFSFAEKLSGLHDPILNRLEALKAHGGTNIARSLLAALDHCDVLSNKGTKGKAIILVSDGISTIDEEEGEEIVSRSEEAGIKIYWVWVKSVERSESLNQHYSKQAESVEVVVEASGGKIFKTAPEDIEEAISEIGRLETTPIVTVEEEATQVYHLRPFLLAALALFIPAVLIETVKEVS